MPPFHTVVPILCALTFALVFISTGTHDAIHGSCIIFPPILNSPFASQCCTHSLRCNSFVAAFSRAFFLTVLVCRRCHKTRLRIRELTVVTLLRPCAVQLGTLHPTQTTCTPHPCISCLISFSHLLKLILALSLVQPPAYLPNPQCFATLNPNTLSQTDQHVGQQS
jgi:hypothetical protein